MSMNLAFLKEKGGYQVDFPFQTPTALSYAVLKAPSVERKMELLIEYLNKYPPVSSHLIKKCEKMLRDTSFQLGVV